MLRVTKSRPCPVCGKPDWCLVSEDGSAAICPRVSQNAVKRCGDGGWLHILKESPYKPQRITKLTFSVSDNGNTPRDFGVLPVPLFRLAMLSRQLGVSQDSLKRLGLGWYEDAYAFPMKDVAGNITGYRRRFYNGSKATIKTSVSGLFIPYCQSNYDLILACEGPTDTAAALDLGFYAIGKPNCNSRDNLVVKFVSGKNVVVVSDNDDVGRMGAKRLARQLVLCCPSVRIISPPDGIKDLRHWLNSGATNEDIQQAINEATLYGININIKD